jgi:hypothetical protein
MHLYERDWKEAEKVVQDPRVVSSGCPRLGGPADVAIILERLGIIEQEMRLSAHDGIFGRTTFDDTPRFNWLVECLSVKLKQLEEAQRASG